MKQLSRISIFFFLLLAIGCSSQTEPSTSLPVTATIEKTEIPKPTSTPTTSLSPTPEQITIEFPEWVNNPETQILLVPIGTRESGYENMALFNAESGERFDIPFTKEVGDYFWMPDGSGFGFLPQDKNDVMFFLLGDRSVINISLSEEILRFHYHNSDVDSIQVTSSNFTDPNFLIIPDWYPLSSNGKFFEYQEGYDNTYTSIFDVSNNQILNISDPNDGYFDLFSGFSPNSKFIAISQADEEPGNYYAFENSPTIRLIVYDIESQQVVASYKNLTFQKWSPDGTKFLFQEWRDSDFYWFAESPPCIFDTISGETECYEVNSRIVNPYWSPNQTMISYIYSSDEAKGFCTIKLNTEEKNCVIEKLETEEQVPIDYLWSPNSNFIVFVYDTSCPYCDYIDSPKLGIANVLTGEYFSIGDNVDIHSLGLWRPSPNP